MTVITKLSTRRNTKTSEREVSEFDGYWINVGVSMEGDVNPEDENDVGPSTFVRLPRGIAVSDLKPRRIYETMDPDYAAQSNLMNQLIAVIEDECGKLEEGDSIPLNLELRLYRRQEETEVAPTKKANKDLRAALFGT